MLDKRKTGLAVNKDGITGPFRKIIDINSSEVFLLDGTSIGYIKDIN